MFKILFVCYGNICRSPMAEFVFKKMLVDRNVTGIEVCSRATSSEELGNPVYPPAKREMQKHGISCEGKYAQQLLSSDYQKYDLFVIMDENNARNIKRIFPSDSEGKIKKLMEYTQRGGNVVDPWYSGDFATCYRDIYDGCTALLESLASNNLI